MTYSYRILPLGLRATADAAVAWFIKDWGIKKSSVVVEEQFHPDVNYRPTFHIRLDDGHILCIEVSEKIYDNTLDSVSLACRETGLPVMLVVAVPKDVSDPDYGRHLKDAKTAGVGILEADVSSGHLIQKPLSLSLAGVRHLDVTEFPARFRQNLQRAHQTFRDGEPSKACSLVYDELEACFRTFAEKCVKKRLWANAQSLDLKKGPWANIISSVDRTLDRSSPLTKEVTPTLLARILGVTPHRNDTGHKIRDMKVRIRRDKELRTRFEGAVDLFQSFLLATRKLRL